MKNHTQQMAIPELVEALVSLLESKKYSKVYLQAMRHTFNQFLKFCDSIGENQFNEELWQQFIVEHYGHTQDTDPRNVRKMRRLMDMLLSFKQSGEVFPRRKKPIVFPSQFSNQISGYFEALRRNFASESTIRRHGISLRRLTVFLDEQCIKAIADIMKESLNDYIKIVLCNYNKGVILTELGVLRQFLRYLHTNGDLSVDLSISLPKHRISRIPSNLPSTFTPDEVERILSSVDRSGPLGKRNYAILMLAAKLGLRTCDIKNLRYENIDWENQVIRLSQTKTNEPLILPLPSDVGWAIIDYMRYGRPISEAPEIFIRVAAPHVSLVSFDHILVKALRHANIPLNKTIHHGLHTLRHSLATEMLGQETPIYVIQEVLGHTNAHTTKRYLSIDVEQLRTCALEVDSL